MQVVSELPGSGKWDPLLREDRLSSVALGQAGSAVLDELPLPQEQGPIIHFSGILSAPHNY